MVARYLITTAIEKTWPADDVPILFLGEWCRLYGRKPAWEKRDSIVAPYHWDDRNKLQQDFVYLLNLYEHLLEELVIQLNELHGVDHSVRYWRLIVGPWLGSFLQMLFDRWTMLQLVVNKYEISGVRILKYEESYLVPNDMEAFPPLFIDDPWNELIYGQILEWMGVLVDKVDVTRDTLLSKGDNTNQVRPQIKSILGKAGNLISTLLSRNDEHFFINSYLSMTQDFLLQAKLGQVPKLWRSVAAPVSTFDPALRQWKMVPTNHKDNFSALARTLIPNHIPKVYIEGFRKLVSLAKNLPWPKQPKTIFTSNSYNGDDVFKVWAANKVEEGVPLIIGQHGGNYGMALWSFSEEHQIAIADQFISWGWKEEEKNNIIPIGNLKGFDNKAVACNEGIALLVEMAIPRQSYHLWSSPVGAGQWLEYFDGQCHFVQALPIEIREQLLVRLYPQDYGLLQGERWRTHFPNIKLDEGIESMSTLLKKTRIYISTYNATSYLESLSLNFPTIIFWNPKYWDLRDSALPYFQKLKSIGIFHETPESAAKHMTEIWNDVSGWWQSANLQAVRKEFCEQYAHIPKNPSDLMGEFFGRIVNNKTTDMDSIVHNENQR